MWCSATDFPTPLRPRMHTVSPGITLKLTRSSTRLSPNDLETSLNSTYGAWFPLVPIIQLLVLSRQPLTCSMVNARTRVSPASRQLSRGPPFDFAQGRLWPRFSSIQHLCVTGASISPPPILPAYSDSATSLPKSPPATALLRRPLASRPRRTASQSCFFPPAMIVPLAPRTVADTRHRAAANLRLRVE